MFRVGVRAGTVNKGYGYEAIAGVFQNRTTATLGSAFLTFTLIDRHDAVVGSAMAVLDALLPPGSSWKFKGPQLPVLWDTSQENNAKPEAE